MYYIQSNDKCINLQIAVSYCVLNVIISGIYHQSPYYKLLVFCMFYTTALKKAKLVLDRQIQSKNLHSGQFNARQKVESMPSTLPILQSSQMGN